MSDQGRFPPNFFLAVADSSRQRNQPRLVMIWKRKCRTLRNRKRFLGGCDGVQKRDKRLPGLAVDKERKENLEGTPLPLRFMRVFNVDLIFFWRYWRLFQSNINHRWHSQYPSAVWLHNQHCILATSWFVMKCLNIFTNRWCTILKHAFIYQQCKFHLIRSLQNESSIDYDWYTQKHTLKLIFT